MSHTLPGKTWGQIATSPRGVSTPNLRDASWHSPISVMLWLTEIKMTSQALDPSMPPRRCLHSQAKPLSPRLALHLVLSSSSLHKSSKVKGRPPRWQSKFLRLLDLPLDGPRALSQEVKSNPCHLNHLRFWEAECRLTLALSLADKLLSSDNRRQEQAPLCFYS